jgi:hypothetical protein
MHNDYLVLKTDEQGRLEDWEISPDLPIAKVLGRTGVWVGETLFNLRGALDYLVYEIACVCNQHRHVRNTQFPICDDPEVFMAQATGKHPRTGKRVTCRLKHVPPAVVARIAELQPCSDPACEWTRLLRELSNPAKHEGIGSFRSAGQFLPSSHPELRGLVADDEEGTESHYFTAQVFFKEPRLDVVDTLEWIQREVRALVAEFKPAFTSTAS